MRPQSLKTCKLLNAVLAPPTGQRCQEERALLLQQYYTGSVFGTAYIQTCSQQLDLHLASAQTGLLALLFLVNTIGGQSLWRVKGCQGGTCPKCSLSIWPDFPAQHLVGKFCKLMDHSDSVTVLWTPPVFYKQCVSDLCIHEGLQAARWCSLAEYTSVCLSHKAASPIRLQFLLGGLRW